VACVWHKFSLDHWSWAHLSAASNWIGIQTGVHGFDSRTPHKPVVSKSSEPNIWLSSYRRTEGRLSATLSAKGCVLSTQQERSLKWIDLSEWWWREERWTSTESLWLPAAIGTWRYPNDWELWVWCFLSVAPRPHSSKSEEFLHSTILRPKKPLGSWILISQLFSE
jgi:hypothetical protein